ncbi:MAG: SufE family protein [Nanoarchaeota archaeon]|nr:SufE family protein [Nanoarchaeota archaeon]
MIKTKELVIQELKDLEEEFEYMESPMEKMEFILEFAKEFEVDSTLVEKEEFLVRGCVSRAYVDVHIENERNSPSLITIHFFADAMIIKGFFGLIKQILDDTLQEDLKENIELIKKSSSNIGLESFLSPNRSNALYNIFNKIEMYI